MFCLFSIWLGVLSLVLCFCSLSYLHRRCPGQPVCLSLRPFAPLLPPFYCALLSACREVNGSYSRRPACFVVGSLPPHHFCPVADVSAKHVHQFLLSEHRSLPHCEEKFRPQYGELYWPSTWSQLFAFDLDRPVIDLSWKAAHGVLYTADQLIGFSY